MIDTGDNVSNPQSDKPSSEVSALLGGSDKDGAQAMLVVGDLQRWLGEGRKMPVLPGLRFAGLSELTPALIEEIKPEIVISALMCPAFDALDVAAKLAETGYTGRYRALSETLPNPQVIRAEVRSVAPDLDFDLFQIAPPTESTNQ